MIFTTEAQRTQRQEEKNMLFFSSPCILCASVVQSVQGV